jgi:structural maintenance of chromosome 2
MQTITEQKERELKKGGQFQQLQQQVNELANLLTRVHTQHSLKEKSLEEEKENLATLEANHVKVYYVQSGLY